MCTAARYLSFLQVVNLAMGAIPSPGPLPRTLDDSELQLRIINMMRRDVNRFQIYEPLPRMQARGSDLVVLHISSADKRCWAVAVPVDSLAVRELPPQGFSE